MKTSTQALKNSVIKYTNLSTKETDFALDAKSCAAATGLLKNRIYVALKDSGCGRCGNYLLKLVPIEDFIADKESSI